MKRPALRKIAGGDCGNLLTLKEAADRCALSSWTLRRYARQGRISSVKISNRLLIPEFVVLDLIARNFREADAPVELRLA